MSAEESIGTFRNEVVAGLTANKTLLEIAKAHGRTVPIYRELVPDLDKLLAEAGHKPLPEPRFSREEIDKILELNEKGGVTYASLRIRYQIGDSQLTKLLRAARLRRELMAKQENRA